MPRLTFVIIALAALLALLPAQAKAPWVKKAQDLGFADIQNCQSCHAKTPALNELGQWLKDEKLKRKVAEVDLAWLKDRPKK